MKLSKFNVLVKPQGRDDLTILYNTFHDHRLVIENGDVDLHQLFHKVEEKTELSEAEMENIPLLKDLGIILSDDEDERKTFDTWYQEKIQGAHDLLHVTLVLTMACNLRCPYCFEKEMLDNSRKMSRETADEIIAWIKKRMESTQAQQLEVTYFGGEPLMNKEILYHISSQLKDYSQGKNIHYEGGMISNGVLMSPEVSQQLRKVGLTWVKITLDGEKSQHDLTRISAKGKGSFDKIWFNLEHCNDQLEGEEPLTILLGGNFSDESFYSFYNLIGEIAESNFRSYLGPINFKPIQDFTMKDNSEGKKCGGACSTKCFDDNNTRKMILLRNALKAADLEPVDHLNLGPCDFFRGDSFSIGLDGSIYTCPADFDIAEHAVGHVSKAKTLPEHKIQHEQWFAVKAWTEECYNCSFLPVCVGGCQAKAYSDGYDWNATVCEKDYFKKMTEALSHELIENEISPENNSFEQIQVTRSGMPMGN